MNLKLIETQATTMTRQTRTLGLAILIVAAAGSNSAVADDTDQIPNFAGQYEEVRRYSAPEARQAVAVDAHHFYAIVNTMIAKYDKKTGKLVKRWVADDERPLKHMNAGIVRDGKLYCSNSNYPKYPEASSVEVWNTDLQHIESHSLGIYEGSLTWIEPAEDGWWAVFAHYSEKVNENPHAKSHRWTSLVKFDHKWRRMAGWVFPDEVLDRFDPHSCSGGSWGPDGGLYCTGHDRGELYRLELPKAGPTLKLTGTFKAPITGQGIAWDVDESGKLTGRLFGINRPTGEVIVSELKKP